MSELNEEWWRGWKGWKRRLYLVSVEAPGPDENGDLLGDVIPIKARSRTLAALIALTIVQGHLEHADWHVSNVTEA